MLPLHLPLCEMGVLPKYLQSASVSTTESQSACQMTDQMLAHVSQAGKQSRFMQRPNDSADVNSLTATWVTAISSLTNAWTTTTGR